MLDLRSRALEACEPGDTQVDHHGAAKELPLFSPLLCSIQEVLLYFKIKLSNK